MAPGLHSHVGLAIINLFICFLTHIMMGRSVFEFRYGGH